MTKRSNTALESGAELLKKHKTASEEERQEIVEQLKKLAQMYSSHKFKPLTEELIGGRPEPEPRVEEVPHPVPGLMGQIYCWVAGKAPKTNSWNHRQNLLTLEQIRTGHKREAWATGYGMVSGRYSGFLCVDAFTKPARPELPDVTFRQVSGGKSISDLPPSATVVSGKPGRKRIYLRVASEWWPRLAGYSFDRGDLELRRWEDGGPEAPAAKQSVIDGPHPEGDYYCQVGRWPAEGGCRHC